MSVIPSRQQASALPPRAERWLRRLLRRFGYRILALSPEEWRYIESTYDDTLPLPQGAEKELASDHPRLQELRQSYAALDWPVVKRHSVWSPKRVSVLVDLSHFRGDTQYFWHYREQRTLTAFRYFVFLEYLAKRDPRGLLKTLAEDGAFGCWTFDFPGRPRVSRDLLDSINELYFLDRQLGLLDKPEVSVLDIGAGYGRLAYHFTKGVPGLRDYCCVDAIPESTFICEYYLRHRQSMPPARVVALPDVPELQPGTFDLAMNIHSFSECPYAAVEWWVGQVERLQVPWLFIVPNQPRELLTTEPGGGKRDFAPLLEAAGYTLTACEPVLADGAVRELLGVHDHFFLYRRR